uniref:Mab-21 domain-containing protein n=1 Tax=Macrostomum lignano TaxID=282301 RepID=A0A1I8FXA2_9PLAT
MQSQRLRAERAAALSTGAARLHRIPSRIADVLQQILRSRLRYDDFFIVGSYSEGWGNSLTTLDGRTDANSDIDVMMLLPGREYHQRGLCECDGAPEQHEFCERAHSVLRIRPALDDVSACRLCRYPPIAPLQPNRVSNIPHPVLEALRKALTSASSPCHVVHAASPDRGGEELRVNCFVTLKYLVKKVICHKNGFNQQGLKSYHVKTITFRMVDETPVEQWKKENLVSLTRQSLQMLLDCVEKSREQDRQTPDTPDRSRGRIMNHFFLSDAAIYLKGADKERVDQHLDGIMSTLRTVIDRLPQLLQQFIGSLRPVSDSGTFYFHPFQILPDLSPMPLTESSALEYYQIYDVESLTELIARLPDCALSAREALRALACLKFGYRGTAERVVSSCSGHSVSRGIAWSREKSATEATEEFVMRHLRSRDTAWKFCFQVRPATETRILARSSEGTGGIPSWPGCPSGSAPARPAGALRTGPAVRPCRHRRRPPRTVEPSRGCRCSLAGPPAEEAASFGSVLDRVMKLNGAGYLDCSAAGSTARRSSGAVGVSIVTRRFPEAFAGAAASAPAEPCRWSMASSRAGLRLELPPGVQMTLSRPGTNSLWVGEFGSLLQCWDVGVLRQQRLSSTLLTQPASFVQATVKLRAHRAAAASGDLN